jgi:putative redox protein
MSEHLEVNASWAGGYECRVRAREQAITIDEPVENGGGDRGMMPTEALCAAIASCFCLALGHVAGKRRIELPGLTVVVRAYRAGRELRYDRFEIDARAEVPGNQLGALIESAKRFCWVSNTLTAGVQLDYTYTSVDGRTPR